MNMNRIESLFSRKKSDILSVFLTAGHPNLHDTARIIDELYKQGVDMVEVGIPFSDPMADGPTIQASSTVALHNGMNLHLLLDQVEEARKLVSPDFPIVVMGYLNPIMQYGFEEFFRRCSEIGVDGLIIPDLPFDDYLSQIQPLSRKYHIPVIMLITPETSEERIHLIDKHCDGFIYMVSAASTTGTRDKFDDAQLSYFQRINAMNLNHPRLIGFGISNPLTRSQAAGNASGVIIGSLFIKCLEANRGNIPAAVTQLKRTIGLQD